MAQPMPTGNASDRIRGRAAQNRYGLVILLILLAYGLSVANLPQQWTSVVLFVQILTVWVVFSASESPRAQRIAGFFLVIIAVLGLVGFVVNSRNSPPDWAYETVLLFSVVLYVISPLVIGRHLFQRRVIDLQTLFGAVASYLLVGMLFGFLYRLVGSLQTSDFFGDQGDGTLSQTLFFSFTTLTTTGYGNLVPAGNPGQSLSMLEAIAGQLILVTAVAKIVSDYQPKGKAEGVGTE